MRNFEGFKKGINLGGWLSQCRDKYNEEHYGSFITEADIESSFKSGGINQTVHSVSMRVKTTVNIILPCGLTSVSLETAVPVTETVIVGNVPDIFAGNSPLR